MGRKDAEHPFIFDRCREFQANPYGYLDLWARGHYKSTVITHAHSIFEVLNDPEITIGIFSNTKPIAKGLLRTIKQEFEQNELMKALYPNILYQHPEKESPKWSEDIGLQVKRESRKKECTLEAWGVVEGQPISKHFDLLVYDDVVTDDNSKTGDQIQKTTDSIKLSFALGSTNSKRIFVGTRYSAGDSYETLMQEGTVIPRIHPGRKGGMVDGEPVFLSEEELERKRREMGPYIFSCHCAGTKVTMADWTFRNIEDVKVGDEVVGFSVCNKTGNITPCSTKVVAVGVGKKECVCSIIDNLDGDTISCRHSIDHKWFDFRLNTYSTLGNRKGQTAFLYELTGDGVVSWVLDSQKNIGTQTVYRIQTETGNYIANGFASKNCQILQNPVAENAQGFKEEWLNYYEKVNPKDMNIYITVDPASSKKKYSDYTVMSVIGLGRDQNYYLLDMVRDKLNLTERVEELFKLRQKWQPRAVGYEKYSMQADIEYIKQCQEEQSIRFRVIPLGGNMAKVDRVKRLIPLFEDNRFYIPKMIMYLTKEGKKVNLIENFMYEYLNFPRTAHDDTLDSISRIVDEDLRVKFPNKLQGLGDRPKSGNTYIYGF